MTNRWQFMKLLALLTPLAGLMKLEKSTEFPPPASTATNVEPFTLTTEMLIKTKKRIYEEYRKYPHGRAFTPIRYGNPMFSVTCLGPSSISNHVCEHEISGNDFEKIKKYIDEQKLTVLTIQGPGLEKYRREFA